MQNVTKHFKLWQTINVNNKINYGTLTQIECSQTTEAPAEHLSLSRPATLPIGTVDKLGSATPRCSLRNSRDEATGGEIGKV